MGEFLRSVRLYRFGVFEVDLRAGELRKRGLRIKLQNQPFTLLVTLLKQKGDLVTQESYVQRFGLKAPLSISITVSARP
jgi:DNA-binding response OmpR family regulator